MWGRSYVAFQYSTICTSFLQSSLSGSHTQVDQKATAVQYLVWFCSKQGLGYQVVKRLDFLRAQLLTAWISLEKVFRCSTILSASKGWLNLCKSIENLLNAGDLGEANLAVKAVVQGLTTVFVDLASARLHLTSSIFPHCLTVLPPPVWPHMFGCNLIEPSTHNFTIPLSSALRMRGRSFVAFQYLIISFLQSSLSGSHTQVDKYVTAVKYHESKFIIQQAAQLGTHFFEYYWRKSFSQK